ncbi:hypothetical protein SE17_10620 [Kouleothrix aurantiaca]|uniref:Uncharacterized protein n=1 Tax=Kouleothrix aurantiaca TaxID=186479 RepID=A0A0P9HEU2_9CHLR|nr:hypothetical protein SE17_10620 [Kouleothrix aurantiaca]
MHYGTVGISGDIAIRCAAILSLKEIDRVAAQRVGWIGTFDGTLDDSSMYFDLGTSEYRQKCQAQQWNAPNQSKNDR